ncbi:MAG TPA: sucrase ferredoxin [Acidimicrobiales bacterium]|nr:sucrase ferredoxin [Acidimicrobiales bacterium]
MASDGDNDKGVRCSVWAREVHLSPISTIGCYRGFLLVESPLPWPRDVAEMPVLAGVARAAAERSVRLQALVPSEPGGQRVILYHNPGPTFSSYRRYESKGEEAVEHFLDDSDDPDLVLGDRDDPGTALGDRDGPGPALGDGAGVDLLVCTHGRRDVCCGSRGTELALRLAAGWDRDGVNLWRTSHTGGHRFAPTFLVLPQGTAWAYADAELVANVLDRSVPFAEVADRYRGCAGLPSPEVQAVEREVLRSVGWELLDRPRTGMVTGERTADGGLVTRLEAGADRWEAVVRPGRTMPVPDCMKPLSEAKKSETELAVSDLRAVA